MTKRHFKIGDYSIGGIIRVSITNSMITIRVLDKDTKKVLLTNPFVMTEISYWNMRTFLNQITTSHYAKEIMNHIEDKSGISKLVFKNK